MQFIRNLSIRSKLFSVFVVFVLIPSIAIGIIATNLARNTVQQQMGQSNAAMAQLFNNHISDYISAREGSTEFLAKQLTTDLIQSPGRVNSVLTNMLKSNSSFMNVYVGTKTGQMILRPMQQLPATYDPRKRPWYQDAMAHPGTVVVTQPYRDVTTNDMVITIAETTADGYGVAAIDMNLNTLTDLAKTFKVGKNGYVEILDGNKNFIANPKGAAGVPDKQSFVSNLYSQQVGALSANVDSQLQDVNYVTNDATGWKIVTLLPQSEFSQAVMPIVQKTIIVILIALLIAGILGFLFVRLMTRTLYSLVSFTGKVAEGDLTSQIEIRSTDEFGKLGKRFNEMVQSLRAVTTDVSLTSEKLSASAEQLSAGAGESSAATQQVALAVQETASGADKQAHRVEQNAQTVSEMTQSMEQIADNANRASTSAVDALHVASNGSRSIESAVEHMNSIHHTVNELADSIRGLGEESLQIEQIVSVITSIAGQTNLLSLNAAIEAARAGESGRGFAVVAAEVRQLAEQSTAAAKRISDVIKGIQGKIQQTVSTMEESTKKVADGLSTVDTAGQSFKQIEKSVEVVVSEVQGVSASAEQMSSQAEELREMMREISQITTDTSASMQTVAASTEEQLASMEEVAASAESLSKIAEELLALIQKFKV